MSAQNARAGTDPACETRRRCHSAQDQAATVKHLRRKADETRMQPSVSHLRGDTPGMATEQRPVELILARGLMSNITTPAFLVDLLGTLVFFNDAAGELLGLR